MENPIRVSSVMIPENIIQIDHKTKDSLINLAEELKLPVYLEQDESDDDKIYLFFDGNICHRYDETEE